MKEKTKKKKKKKCKQSVGKDGNEEFESRGSTIVDGVVKEEANETLWGDQVNEIKRLENLIQERKNMLVKVKEKVQNVIDGQYNERKNMNKILMEAENQIDIFNKEKIKNDQKIKDLEQMNDEPNEK